ncbi:MAG: ThiF family adenylyltransferase [Gammaproteobacteria bacterium AqS3]|nr:ThiF family adenylyltransferase [Gammaproteobacteria bacterium AqS3]
MGETNEEICAHLLQHFNKGEYQEDLCFALWRPSTGQNRYSALIYKAILPHEGERNLHGNVEFNPNYLSRAINLACREGAGLAFMHSHPSDGWQAMSQPDVVAEKEAIFYPAQATQLPLLGLTVGTDGYWSARFWIREGRKNQIHWCQKVRVVGEKKYQLYHNDALAPAPKRRNILRRTYDTWGAEKQNDIARLKIGVVGLGSVGCIVAEALARGGIQEIVLIDPDRVEEHNLDRLLYGTQSEIGQYKVDVAERRLRLNSTAERVAVQKIPLSLRDERAYLAALDCDLLLSCVDRPVARDVLNFIAFAHLIPVIDGGIAIEHAENLDSFFAHWRAHLVTPYHQCMRCNGQYTTSDVSVELDGSLDNPAYVSSLPPEERGRNQNVFPFSLHVAAMEAGAMFRYLVAPDWWPPVQQQDYDFLRGTTTIQNDKCRPHCVFQNERIARGDAINPNLKSLIIRTGEPDRDERKSWLRGLLSKFTRAFGKE